MPVVLAELVADVGKSQVGMLRLCDAHRPEKKSRLVAPPRRFKPTSRRKPKRAPEQLSLRKAGVAKDAGFPEAPTRFLPKPVQLHAGLRPGVTFSVGRGLYTIERVAFEHRLDAVEWWSEPSSRDYLRLWLRSAAGVVEALAYVDRESGARYLQAIAD